MFDLKKYTTINYNDLTDIDIVNLINDLDKDIPTIWAQQLKLQLILLRYKLISLMKS